jgi:ASC-1-like (ASCH) protein
MTHEMRLHPLPFGKIKDGTKTIEVRLNDEKRQEIKVGDQIEFLLRPDFAEKVTVEVTELLHTSTFAEMYTLHPKEEFGIEDIDAAVAGMGQYYSPEDEQKYGVLGIKFKKV